MTDIMKIIEERDRTFALMLARVEKAEADNDRLRAALKAIELARLTDTKEDWTRATKLSDAVLGEKA